MILLKVKKLRSDAKLPCYAHNGDVGLDIYSVEDVNLKSSEKKIIKTGISIEFPKGYAVLVWDRSGLAARNSITSIGGVFDPGYRGEYNIILLNAGKKSYKIKKGDKIAQLLVQKVEKVKIVETKKLKNSKRGKGGFGSTGR